MYITSPLHQRICSQRPTPPPRASPPAGAYQRARAGRVRSVLHVLLRLLSPASRRLPRGPPTPSVQLAPVTLHGEMFERRAHSMLFRDAPRRVGALHCNSFPN